MKHVEIVVPCYNEQDCIELLCVEIGQAFRELEDVTWSVLFIDDGSRDHTLKEIIRMADTYGNQVIRYISFARNFGKESAIYAGLKNCKGDYIVLMDADLQHPPSLIPQMLKEMEAGYDCVGARRVSRKGEPVVRSFLSGLFYRVINRITNMKLVQGGSDYRMMTKQMADAVVSLNERERFTKGILSWVGFDVTWIEYENVERAAGKTKWSLTGLIRYAVSGYLAFATSPLRAVIYFGMLIVFFSFLYAIHFLVYTLRSNGPRNGYATIVLLLMFFSGVIITVLGVIGEYIARIYDELKQRPIYIAKRTNIEEQAENGVK